MFATEMRLESVGIGAPESLERPRKQVLTTMATGHKVETSFPGPHRLDHGRRHLAQRCQQKTQARAYTFNRDTMIGRQAPASQRKPRTASSSASAFSAKSDAVGEVAGACSVGFAAAISPEFHGAVYTEAAAAKGQVFCQLAFRALGLGEM